jgi:hypothetical protein
VGQEGEEREAGRGEVREEKELEELEEEQELEPVPKKEKVKGKGKVTEKADRGRNDSENRGAYKLNSHAPARYLIQHRGAV